MKIENFEQVKVTVDGKEVENYLLALPSREGMSILVHNVSNLAVEDIIKQLQEKLEERRLEEKERYLQEAKELEKRLEGKTEKEQMAILLGELLSFFKENK